MRELPGPLFIILINHGSPDTFYLTGEQPLTAQELGKWLDIFQDQMKDEDIDRPIVLVLGACYSGSFMDDLSAPGRIVVTSSAGDEPSYRGPANPHSGVRDGEFFTGALFRQLAAGDSLRESFEQAVSQTEAHTHSGTNEKPAPYRDTAKQHPLLDDNGDGQGTNNLNAGDDGDSAEGIFLGPANAGVDPLAVTSAGTEPNTPPPLDFSESQAVLWAEVSDADRAEAVWVEIREPGMILEGGETQQTIDLTSLALERDGSTGQYQASYAGFDKPGKYTFFFYAKDRQGIISPFRQAFLYKGLPAVRGDATGDEAIDLADVILMLRVLCNRDTGGGGISLAGDCSGDGKIGPEDAPGILRQLGEF